MNMNKKIKAAITIAAIAGTCALTDPAFAAWTSDPPNKLKADIAAGAVGAANNKGAVIVGSEGKVYRISQDNIFSTTPQWNKVIVPAATDFVDVIYDTNCGPDDNRGLYFAVTAAGDLLISPDGQSWRDLPLPAELKQAVKDYDVAGVTTVADGSEDDPDILVVTKRGVFAYFDKSEQSWKSNNVLSTQPIGDYGRIKGVAALPGVAGKVVVFGEGGGDDADANLYVLDLSSDDARPFKAFFVQNCPTINDISIQSTTSWYAVGDSATIIKGTQDLAGEGAVIGSVNDEDDVKAKKLTIKQAGGEGEEPTNYTGDPKLLSIEYWADGIGYISGAEGSIFRFEGESVTYEPQDLTSKNLNAVNIAYSFGGKLRTYASGDDGASIYGSNEYWIDASSAAGLPETADRDFTLVLTDDSKFYVVDRNKKPIYSSTNPDKQWTAETLAFPGNVIFSPYGSVIATEDGQTYIAVRAYDNTRSCLVVVYKIGDKVNAPILLQSNTDNPQIAVERIVVLKHENKNYLYAMEEDGGKLKSRSIAGNSEEAFKNAGPRLDNFVSMGASANGLYAIENENGGVYALVSGESEAESKLDTNPVNTERKWYSVKAVDDYIADNEGVWITKLIQVKNGIVLVDSKNNLLLLTDESEAGVKSDKIKVTSLGCPVDQLLADGLRNVSGSADNVTVSYYVSSKGSAICRYGNNKWETYTGFDEVVGFTYAEIASSGKKILAWDSDKLGYAAGGKFGVVASSEALPVQTGITSVFNATKRSVYVAGQDGLLYKGLIFGGADEISWLSPRYQDAFFGTKDFKKVTGAKDKLFVAFGADGEEEFAVKTDDASQWDLLRKSGITLKVVNDMQALDDKTVLIASEKNNGAGNGLVKGTVSGDELRLFYQSADSEDSTMPESLSALSVLDADNAYGVVDSKLYHFEHVSGDNWNVKEVALTEPKTLNDVIAIAKDKVYVVGDQGYAAVYDGTKATNLPEMKGEPKPALTSCWAYDGFLFVTDSSGKVHTYNAEKGWTASESLRDGALRDITGCASGEYVLAVGDDTSVYREEISASGGGSTNNFVNPNTSDSAVVDSAVPVHREADALATRYGTPENMEVVSDVAQFTTTGGVTAGSTHTFTFNFTPTSDYAYNDMVLYKLKADGTNLTYNRVNSVPASPTSGDFWITTSVGDAVGAGETLAAGTTYSVYFAIEDGSKYDDDDVAGKITDPAVLGTDSSSGGSGCVFNPAQTFGIEWLMLAFAPVAAFFRSRFKK